MSLPPPTERLAFRPLTAGHLEFTAELLSHPEVMRYYPKPLSRAEASAWIEKQRRRYEDDGHGLWLVAERRSGNPVGQVGLAIQTVDGAAEPEIGYLLHRPYWGLGLATEAALAVREHAFAALDYPRVISLVRPVNAPSRAVATRIRMRPRGTTQFAGLEHIVCEVQRPRAPEEPKSGGRLR